MASTAVLTPNHQHLLNELRSRASQQKPTAAPTADDPDVKAATLKIPKIDSRVIESLESYIGKQHRMCCVWFMAQLKVSQSFLSAESTPGT
jgi:hypothetical protein